MTFDSNSVFLLIDDDDIFRKRLARAIKDRGYAVFECGIPEEAILIVKKVNPTHIVLDLRMPKVDGLEVLKEIRKINSVVKILILTGYGSIATALEAINEGALNYLSKPTDLDGILDAFKSSAQKPEKLKEVPSLSQIEWEHIQRVLYDCKGNVTKASKILKIHRRSLQRKLKMAPS